jgi:tRNA-2-methylthio-N6-dimethylallyladenosine synthase
MELPNQKPKVFLETLGCQSNFLESEHVTGLLLKNGYSMAPDIAEADVVLFNTCSVRQHAEQKVFSRLGLLEDWKKEKAGRVIGVLGCMATIYKEKIRERAPQVDLVVGADQYPNLVEAIGKARDFQQGRVLADFDPVYFPENDPSRLIPPHKAFIEIMKGCDKYCTFCVVPFARGREVSRPAEDILREIRGLAQAGVKEIMLLGQNVNSYGLNGSGQSNTTFPRLVRQAGEIPGIQRVRFMTSHPLDLPDELVEAMAAVPAVCESIHLPVQCGSDAVLKRMNRKHRVDHYLERVNRLRSRVKDLAVTTDLMVGFPGETEEDFRDTLNLLDGVKFDAVYSFKYSPRPGTPAGRMPDQVPEEVKEERLGRLNQKAWKHSAESCERRLGKVEEVLVEGPADKTPDASFGKSRQNRTVVFGGTNFKPGDLVKVRIDRHKVANLYGTAIT